MRPTEPFTLACAAAAAAASAPCCLRQQRYQFRFLRPADPHLLGQRPGHIRGRRAGPGPGARQVHQADRDQGQPGGHRLDDLLNRILAATVSGKGPTSSTSATPGRPRSRPPAPSCRSPVDHEQIGDTGRFLPGASPRPAPRQAAGGVPLYCTAYGLYYNKAEFAAAGISGPPATWVGVRRGRQEADQGQPLGLTVEAGQIPENVHLAFELSQQQGGSFFDSAGKPTFDTPQNVAAVKQMIDFMQTDKIANPSDAQYSNGTEALNDYATGKAAMLLWQTAPGRWPSWA